MNQSDNSAKYAHKWLVLSAVGTGIFLGTLNGSIVNIALPTLVREFATSFQAVQWVVLSFLLTTAALLLSMGKLGDTIGKRPVYVTGLIIFIISSTLCGLAPSLGWLIGFRVMQAVGAAMIQALGLAIATEAFPSEERGLAVGYAGGLVSLGVVAGPTLGGFIVEALAWPWIFFINIPVGITGLILTFRFVPKNKPISREPFDFVGAGLLLAGIVLVLLSLTQGQSNGFRSTEVWSLFGGGLFTLILFVIVELRVAHPMVDLRLFQNRYFTISLLSGLFVFTFLGGGLLLLPFYLEDMLGFNTQSSGLLIGLVPIILGVLAPIAGRLSDRIGTRPITTVGLLVIVIGYATMSRLSLETTAFTFVLLVLPFAAGLGLFQSPNNSSVLGAVDHESLGVASGMLAITRNLGTLIGTALVGTIWTAYVVMAHGNLPMDSATSAPLDAQVSGLQSTFVLVTFVMFIPLALSLWGWWLGRAE